MMAKSAAGLKVARLPAQLAVPATAAPPGPVTVNVVAGEAIVEHWIASLKIAVMGRPIGTPVAAFAGIVAVTAGGGVIVVKVHT